MSEIHGDNIPIRTDNLGNSVSKVEDVKMWAVKKIEVEKGGMPALIRTIGRGPCSVLAVAMFSPEINAAVISHSPEITSIVDMKIRNQTLQFLKSNKVTFAKALWVYEDDGAKDEIPFSTMKEKLQAAFEHRGVQLEFEERITESFGSKSTVPNIGILLNPPDSNVPSRFIIDSYESLEIKSSVSKK